MTPNAKRVATYQAKQRAKVERMREALERIAELGHGSISAEAVAAAVIAREALK